VSDIALELVDSLKVLDPDGRLEKQTLPLGIGLWRFVPKATSCTVAKPVQIATVYAITSERRCGDFIVG
jgi:hypothetical protein